MALPPNQKIHNTDARSLAKAADDNKRLKYPVYQFSGKTFYEKDESNLVADDPPKVPYNPTPG